MEVILKNEYIGSDKRRLINPYDLDDFINSRFGQNTLKLLEPNRQRLHTRYNNYIIYEYLYEESKKGKDWEKMEADWKISFPSSMEWFLKEAVGTDKSLEVLLERGLW